MNHWFIKVPKDITEEQASTLRQRWSEIGVGECTIITHEVDLAFFNGKQLTVPPNVVEMTDEQADRLIAAIRHAGQKP